MRRRAVRMLRAVMIGVATLFAAKTERDQHWSTPPTMIVQRKDVDDERGDGDGDGDGLTSPTHLPSCA